MTLLCHHPCKSYLNGVDFLNGLWVFTGYSQSIDRVRGDATDSTLIQYLGNL